MSFLPPNQQRQSTEGQPEYRRESDMNPGLSPCLDPTRTPTENRIRSPIWTQIQTPTPDSVLDADFDAPVVKYIGIRRRVARQTTALL